MLLGSLDFLNDIGNGIYDSFDSIMNDSSNQWEKHVRSLN